MSILPVVLLAGAGYLWMRGRRPSVTSNGARTAELSPLELDARMEGTDFTFANGLQVIRAESVPKLMAQLSQRSVKDAGGSADSRGYFLTKKKNGESAAVWLQKAALAGRGVLLVLDEKPVQLLTVPSSETSKWAQPGRAIVMWGAHP